MGSNPGHDTCVPEQDTYLLKTVSHHIGVNCVHARVEFVDVSD